MIASPVLITGGAGFIGSHLVEAIITRGARVRVLDSLDPHVHGAGATRARHLPSDVERVHTSVCDAAAVDRALTGIASVVHLAAQVGVVQSMYAIVPYVDENVRGTAVLLDRLAAAGRRIRRLVVASSMSIYGEGRYGCPTCGPVAPLPRPLAQLQAREWELATRGAEPSRRRRRATKTSRSCRHRSTPSPSAIRRTTAWRRLEKSSTGED